VAEMPLNSSKSVKRRKETALRKKRRHCVFVLSSAGVCDSVLLPVLAIQLIFDYRQKSWPIYPMTAYLRSALLQMDEEFGLIRNEVSIDIRGSALPPLAQAEEDRVFYKVESLEQGFYYWLSRP